MLLLLIQNTPSAAQRDMSATLGVSLGLINYCLNSLIEKGLVKISNFKASDQKLKYAYVLSPSGIAEKSKLTARFLKRKIKEFEKLQAEIDALKRELT